MIDLLRANLGGLDQTGFIATYFARNPPASQSDKDFYWSEFKRAAQYSNAMFDLREEGWSFVRALAGPRRGQFYYVAVATIVSGQPAIEAPYPIAEQLDERTTAEWRTRTRSRMRIRVADLHSKMATGDPRLMAEAEKHFDDIFLVSTRLAAINFDFGMSIEDLRELADPRDPRLRILNKPIKNALDAIERAQDRINELAAVVHGLQQIVTTDRRRLGEGAGRIDKE